MLFTGSLSLSLSLSFSLSFSLSLRFGQSFFSTHRPSGARKYPGLQRQPPGPRQWAGQIYTEICNKIANKYSLIELFSVSPPVVWCPRTFVHNAFRRYSRSDCQNRKFYQHSVLQWLRHLQSHCTNFGASYLKVKLIRQKHGCGQKKMFHQKSLITIHSPSMATLKAIAPRT